MQGHEGRPVGSTCLSVGKGIDKKPCVWTLEEVFQVDQRQRPSLWSTAAGQLWKRRRRL